MGSFFSTLHSRLPLRTLRSLIASHRLPPLIDNTRRAVKSLTSMEASAIVQWPLTDITFMADPQGLLGLEDHLEAHFPLTRRVNLSSAGLADWVGYSSLREVEVVRESDIDSEMNQGLLKVSGGMGGLGGRADVVRCASFISSFPHFHSLVAARVRSPNPSHLTSPHFIFPYPT